MFVAQLDSSRMVSHGVVQTTLAWTMPRVRISGEDLYLLFLEIINVDYFSYYMDSNVLLTQPISLAKVQILLGKYEKANYCIF